METMVVTWGIFIATFIAVLWFVSKRKSNIHGETNKPLPPGSMGLPFIGETLHYLTPFHSSNGGPFFRKRFLRYGEVFKTHLFGKPTIVTASGELNQFVFQNEGKLFRAAYPDAFVNLLGKKTTLQTTGTMHKKLRQLGQCLVGYDNIRSSLLQEVEDQVLSTFSSWKDAETIQLKHEAEKITFFMLMKQFVSMDSGSSESHELLKSYSEFMAGIFSFPINIRGTTYAKCSKGRERILNFFRDVISERRSQNRERKQDFLDEVLERTKAENPEEFTDEVLLDFLFGFLFAGYDTTSIAMTMAVKYLSQCPAALQKLREEHEEIVEEKRKRKEFGLSWEDYKSMAFTRNVIKETLRLAVIAPYLYRECIEETEIKGYRIPKGWKVVACVTAAHLDSSTYHDPLSFNPWRWEKDLNESCFQAFGGGSRFCVGFELAKLEMSVFLHYLVTEFSWDRNERDNIEVVRCPVVLFGKGFPITVHKRNSTTINHQ